MTEPTSRTNSLALKCLSALLVGLLLAAITGGFMLTREVSAMGAKIEALTLTVRDMNGRILYLERAIRLANRDGDA